MRREMPEGVSLPPGYRLLVGTDRRTVQPVVVLERLDREENSFDEVATCTISRPYEAEQVRDAMIKVIEDNVTEHDMELGFFEQDFAGLYE